MIDIQGTDPRLKPALDRLMTAYEAEVLAGDKLTALFSIEGASTEAVKQAIADTMHAEAECQDATIALVAQYQANCDADQRAAEQSTAA